LALYGEETVDISTELPGNNKIALTNEWFRDKLFWNIFLKVTKQKSIFFGRDNIGHCEGKKFM